MPLSVNAAGLGAGLAPPPSLAAVLMSDAMAAMHLTAPRLESAAAITRFGVSSDEHGRRERLMAEWEEWARGYPESMKPTLRWCGPEEVLAFLETWRATHHGRRPPGAPALPADGQHVPIAPPTLKGGPVPAEHHLPASRATWALERRAARWKPRDACHCAGVREGLRSLHVRVSGLRVLWGGLGIRCRQGDRSWCDGDGG